MSRLKSRPFNTLGVVLGLVAAAAGFMAYTAFARSNVPDQPEPTIAVAARALLDAPSPQADALVDGKVTREEAEAAIARTEACARGQGVATELHPGSGLSLPSVGFTVPTIAEGEKARAILVACQNQHSNRVLEVWNAQNRPTEAQSAEGRAWFGACMTGHGVTVPAGPVTESQMLEWAHTTDLTTRFAAAKCTEDHVAAFGFWP